MCQPWQTMNPDKQQFWQFIPISNEESKYMDKHLFEIMVAIVEAKVLIPIFLRICLLNGDTIQHNKLYLHLMHNEGQNFQQGCFQKYDWLEYFPTFWWADWTFQPVFQNKMSSRGLRTVRKHLIIQKGFIKMLNLWSVLHQCVCSIKKKKTSKLKSLCPL